MAKLGRPKTTPNVECPDHPGTPVNSKGTRRTKNGGLRRRYECRPPGGTPHSFTVAEVAPAGVVIPVTALPPPCPKHPGSNVTRAGTYGKGSSRRQRYRCFPIGESAHVFTPVLPRGKVRHGDDECPHCRELTGVHAGPTAFARRHRWPLSVAARGLEKLASGETYAAVGEWALRTEAGKEKVTKPRRSKSTWHIGADWTEAASPVLFDYIDSKLRAAAREERARLDALLTAGKPLDLPQVVVVDEKPVTGKLGKSSRRRAQHGFSVLVVAEVDWSNPTEPQTRLRLARAMPSSTLATWSLVFAELGYIPDVVVADGAWEIEAAAKKVFVPDTVLVPSLYHIGSALTDNLRKAYKHLHNPGSSRVLIRPFTEHFSELRAGGPAVTSAAGWKSWWDRFEVIASTNQVSDRTIENLRSYHEPRLDERHHRIFRDYPMVPGSTGAVEALIRRAVEPMLARRRSGFRNIERTNRLFDLVVCREHGLFDDLSTPTRLLEQDAAAHGGYTTALRTIEDPESIHGRYSSLRDPYNIEQLAIQAGVLK